MSTGAANTPGQYNPQYAPGQNPNQQQIETNGKLTRMGDGTGGGGGAKGAPPPPDYKGAAEAMGQASQQSIGQQTQANRPDINTSFGGQQWTQGPDGQWHMQTSLAPGLQPLQGAFTQQLSGAAGADANARARDAAYNQQLSRLDPSWNLQAEQLQTQLANQGLAPGSAAYQQAMDQFGRNRTDAYQTAYNNAVGLGNQAQAMNYQEGLGGLGALHGFETQQPGFNAAGAWTPANLLAAYEAQGNYGLQGQQLNNQFWGDVMSAGGQALGAGAGLAIASDERLKKNIHRLDVDALPGVPVATFEYRHEPGKTHLGVIAQDLEQVAPDLVEEGPDGIKRVDYSRLPLKPFGTR